MSCRAHARFPPKRYLGNAPEGDSTVDRSCVSARTFNLYGAVDIPLPSEANHQTTYDTHAHGSNIDLIRSKVLERDLTLERNEVLPGKFCISDDDTIVLFGSSCTKTDHDELGSPSSFMTRIVPSSSFDSLVMLRQILRPLATRSGIVLQLQGRANLGTESLANDLAEASRSKLSRKTMKNPRLCADIRKSLKASNRTSDWSIAGTDALERLYAGDPANTEMVFHDTTLLDRRL
ncbi:hypothetical protein FFLO_05381 [Filobasidium floriforme]|uniref:Uncharacterized protein n=1 Tax=Filobasidium floriforme TaxID=5210 RepID=A0A8K0NLI9_9TREE|nr:uncharacterized protein HD553DRAFT_326706 [Filobasidium floriforme]KAG7529841.1 hypothetical protein FFLO_05381 [Filobasidium floriforme]KAH8078996.1 hypothetical protein HD553DRAFT_326706 [Filobasidium floriforme]